jgi:hypothetical protein
MIASSSQWGCSARHDLPPRPPPPALQRVGLCTPSMVSLAHGATPWRPVLEVFGGPATASAALGSPQKLAFVC